MVVVVVVPEVAALTAPFGGDGSDRRLDSGNPPTKMAQDAWRTHGI